MGKAKRKKSDALKPSPTRLGLLQRGYQGVISADKRVKAALGGLGLVGIASGVLTYVPGAWNWVDKTLFRYPIELTYVSQGETKTGYVFAVQIKSTNSGAVFVPRDDLYVRIVKDERVVEEMSPKDRDGLLQGETVKVLDNAATLAAEVDGRTYTKDPNIACTSQARPLFLLVTVAGPGDSNPSLRLQIAPVYRSLSVGVKRWLHTSEYVEIPIAHPSIIAGNDKTRVIQE